MERLAVVEVQNPVFRREEACGLFQDGVEHRLRVGGPPANDSQDLTGSALAIQRRNQLPVTCLELLLRLRFVSERLRQPLLKIVDLGLVFGRLGGDWGLGFLGLRWLWTPAHRPPLASYESAGDRLGERARVSKWRGEPCGAAMSTDGAQTRAS